MNGRAAIKPRPGLPRIAGAAGDPKPKLGAGSTAFLFCDCSARVRHAGVNLAGIQ
jgi:hypothetical protein